MFLRGRRHRLTIRDALGLQEMQYVHRSCTCWHHSLLLMSFPVAARVLEAHVREETGFMGWYITLADGLDAKSVEFHEAGQPAVGRCSFGGL